MNQNKGVGFYFKPCIDLHQGQVKQIVGSTFKKEITENFISPPEQDARFYAKKYQELNLSGGHVIMLGQDNENQRQARLALGSYPQGLHIGGGMNLENALAWLDWGAEKIIFTSYLFSGGELMLNRLQGLKKKIGKERIVIDLSCRPTKDKNQEATYTVATHGWKETTSFTITPPNLEQLSDYCDEFLIHAIDLEGKKGGIDYSLIDMLAEHSPLKWVYAGGIQSLSDIDYLVEKNQRKLVSRPEIGFTVGSSLDLFGGHLALSEVLKRSVKS